MPTKFIKKGASVADDYTGNAAQIGVEDTNHTLQFNSSGTKRTVVTTNQTQTLTNKTLTAPAVTLAPTGLNGSSVTYTTHPINLESATLASNTNVIRGASINPTRTSGWISFSGTVSTSPAQVYTDYRNLTTTGVAEVLGIGSFPMMATGASCASMFGGQFISQVDSGATVLTAASAPMTGIYASTFKTLIDGATVNSGAQIAAAAFSVQANVTDISGRTSAIQHWEVASGAVRDLVFVNATGGAMSTNFFNFSNNASPIVAGGSGSATVASGAWLQVRVVVAGTAYYFPICSALWTNA